MNNGLFGQPMAPQQMPPNVQLPIGYPMAGQPMSQPQGQPQGQPTSQPQGQPMSQSQGQPSGPVYVGDPTLDKYIHMFLGANESSLHSSSMKGDLQ